MTDWLEVIREAANDADNSQRHLCDVVAAARADGVPWKLIGEAFGVSRQAVQQRFKAIQ